jgi:hypothetical protein
MKQLIPLPPFSKGGVGGVICVIRDVWAFPRHPMKGGTKMAKEESYLLEFTGTE